MMHMQYGSRHKAEDALTDLGLTDMGEQTMNPQEKLEARRAAASLQLGRTNGLQVDEDVYLLLTGASYSHELDVPRTPVSKIVQVDFRAWEKGTVYSRLAEIPFNEQRSLRSIRTVLENTVKDRGLDRNYEHTAIRNLKGSISLNNDLTFDDACGGNRVSTLAGNNMHVNLTANVNLTNVSV